MQYSKNAKMSFIAAQEKLCCARKVFGHKRLNRSLQQVDAWIDNVKNNLGSDLHCKWVSLYNIARCWHTLLLLLLTGI